MLCQCGVVLNECSPWLHRVTRSPTSSPRHEARSIAAPPPHEDVTSCGVSLAARPARELAARCLCDAHDFDRARARGAGRERAGRMAHARQPVLLPARCRGTPASISPRSCHPRARRDRCRHAPSAPPLGRIRSRRPRSMGSTQQPRHLDGASRAAWSRSRKRTMPSSSCSLKSQRTRPPGLTGLASRQRLARAGRRPEGRFDLTVRALKDKRSGPGWLRRSRRAAVRLLTSLGPAHADDPVLEPSWHRLDFDLRLRASTLELRPSSFELRPWPRPFGEQPRVGHEPTGALGRARMLWILLESRSCRIAFVFAAVDGPTGRDRDRSLRVCEPFVPLCSAGTRASAGHPAVRRRCREAVPALREYFAGREQASVAVITYQYGRLLSEAPSRTARLAAASAQGRRLNATAVFRRRQFSVREPERCAPQPHVTNFVIVDGETYRTSAASARLRGTRAALAGRRAGR